jgi:hypothetical protein
MFRRKRECFVEDSLEFRDDPETLRRRSERLECPNGRFALARRRMPRVGVRDIVRDTVVVEIRQHAGDRSFVSRRPLVTSFGSSRRVAVPEIAVPGGLRFTGMPAWVPVGWSTRVPARSSSHMPAWRSCGASILATAALLAALLRLGLALGIVTVSRLTTLASAARTALAILHAGFVGIGLRVDGRIARLMGNARLTEGFIIEQRALGRGIFFASLRAPAASA